MKLDEKIDLKELSNKTDGMSGGDIADICAKASLIAFERKNDNPVVKKSDFEQASISKVVSSS